jgi:hypothetical protein
VRCFYLARHTRITLLGALLDVSAVENEVIPVNPTAFEDCHLCLPPLSENSFPILPLVRPILSAPLGGVEVLPLALSLRVTAKQLPLKVREEPPPALKTLPDASQTKFVVEKQRSKRSLSVTGFWRNH